MTKRLWVFDIDGTMADSRHRDHHLTMSPKDWNSFFAHMHMDEPYESVFLILKALKATGDRCVAVTGRDERFREETLEWLNRHDSFTNEDLFMRPAKDRTDDNLIKLDIIRNFEKEGYTIMGIFDDRKRIVDTFRENGYHVFDCNQTGKVF